MATKKTMYDRFKESPEQWLQTAIDAGEITLEERDAIQKFLEAQTQEEADKYMDVLRAGMERRPEFTLSTRDRLEIAEQLDSINDARIALRDEMRSFYESYNVRKNEGASQSDLDAIKQQLEETRHKLETENKRYGTYAMIQALATSEPAQEYAKQWYEEVGRDQGKNLFKAISEFTQSVQAQIRGDLEQAQVHRQNASVAFHGYNDAVARDFERRTGELIPDKAELKHRNELAKNVNKKIATLERVNRDVKAKEAELIKAAQKIALSEYKYRQKFGALSAWAHGTPVDKTFQEIKSYEQAKEFMQSRRPEEVLRIQGELDTLMQRQERAKEAVQQELNKVLNELRGRQENLRAFVLEYEHAIQQGYVNDARADAIAQNLEAAQQYAFLRDAEWLQTFKQFGIDIDKSFTDPSIEPKHEDHAPKGKGHEGPEGPAEPVNPKNETQEHNGPEGPGPNPPAGTQSKPIATMRWADLVEQVENKHKPMETKYIGYYGHNGPEVVDLSPNKEERDKQFKYLKDNHFRYRVMNEAEALKFRGAFGLDKEHAQAWRQAVDKAYAPTNEPTQAYKNSVFQHSAPVAVEIARKISNGATTQDILEYANSIAQQDGERYRIDGAMGTACQLLGCESLTPLIEQIAEFRREQVDTLGHVVDFYPHDEQVQLFLEKFEQSQGHDVPGQEGQDQTDGIDDHDDHGPAMPGE